MGEIRIAFKRACERLTSSDVLEGLGRRDPGIDGRGHGAKVWTIARATPRSPPDVQRHRESWSPPGILRLNEDAASPSERVGKARLVRARCDRMATADW